MRHGRKSYIRGRPGNNGLRPTLSTSNYTDSTALPCKGVGPIQMSRVWLSRGCWNRDVTFSKSVLRIFSRSVCGGFLPCGVVLICTTSLGPCKADVVNASAGKYHSKKKQRRVNVYDTFSVAQGCRTYLGNRHFR